MNTSEVLSHIQREIALCDRHSVDENIETALKYYDGTLPTPVSDQVKFSTVVSRDIQNAVEGTLAQIMPGFASDQPVTFPPLGEGDEQQAELETAAVNWVIMSLCDGYTLFNRAFKDSLLFGNGIIKAGWDARVEPVSQRLTDIPPEVLPAVLQDAQHAQIEDQENGLVTADIVRYRPRNRPRLEWIPLEELLVSPDHLEISLDTARFVCHRRPMPATDLVASGAPRERVDHLSGAHGATSRRITENEDVVGDPAHEANRLIQVAESYYRLDEDDDGVAELRRIVTAGGQNGDQELLMDEPWLEQPFANGVAFFSPRTWRGVTLTERLKDIQDTNSELLRQILDNGWRNLQQRLGVIESLCNMDDLLSSIKGGVVRMKDANAVVPLPNVDPPQSALALLPLITQMRRESGGAAIDTSAQAQAVAGDSAHGIERTMTAIEQGVAVAARNLAETLVKPLYLKTHALLKRHWPSTIPVRQRVGWAQAIPELWPPREVVSVSVGLSQSERDRQARILSAVLQMQQGFAQAGMKLAGPPQMYRTAVDFARLSGLADPEQYFLDPDTPEAKQMAQQEAAAMQQAEQSKHQQAMELATLQGQAAYTVENLRAAMKRYEIDVEHLQKATDQRLKNAELDAKYEDYESPGENDDAEKPRLAAETHP